MRETDIIWAIQAICTGQTGDSSIEIQYNQAYGSRQ